MRWYVFDQVIDRCKVDDEAYIIFGKEVTDLGVWRVLCAGCVLSHFTAQARNVFIYKSSYKIAKMCLGVQKYSIFLLVACKNLKVSSFY